MTVEEVDVAVIGAGFGGLCAAIRLQEEGASFVVLERGGDVGGTWAQNTYPGCRCDVPSTLYSFSFAPNPGWRDAYAGQPEILAYLRDCAERFGVRERVRLGCEVREAAWDADAQRWRVQTSDGAVVARAVIAASGALSEAVTPALDGLPDFEGTVFHTSRWPADADLRGRRVALVGTGATAIQVGPELLRGGVASLHVLQRTPPWVLPHPGRSNPRWLQALYARVPAVQRAARGGVYALRELLALGMTRAPAILRGQELVARGLLRAQVADSELRARLTPGYRLGCKRILLSSEWYPTLADARTEVVTSPAVAVGPRSIRCADGSERDVDAIVLATGFAPTAPAIARRLRGADGRTLAEAWSGSPRAHRGVVVAGFPNLMLLFGPNTNLGSSSIVFMLEAQVHYALQLIHRLRDGTAGALDVRPEVEAASNDRLQRRLARTVWNDGGCASYYFDANGRNATQWPGLTTEYRRSVERLDVREFVVEPAVAPV